MRPERSLGKPRMRVIEPGSVEHEDRRLVARFLEDRDEHGFRAIYRRYSPALGQTILRLVRGNRADADEVLQITWVRAIRGLPNFRWESSLKSWLTGIALNCAREHLRRMRRVDLQDPIDNFDLPVRQIPARVHHRLDVEKAIAALPDGYREVLVLHDIEGYTHAEIAGMLGVEEGTSKSQLFRARRAVRAKLGEADPVDRGDR